MERRVRKNLRLYGWDYSADAPYFVTICVKNKEPLLCTHPLCRGAHCAPATETLQNELPVETPTFALSEAGACTKRAIDQIASRYDSVSVDKYVIMPNHIHLILSIRRPEADEIEGNRKFRCDGEALRDGRTLCAPALSRVVKQMKEYVTKSIGCPIWQRSFYDHIIRNMSEYRHIWDYIDQNPSRWESDEYYRG